MRLTIVAVLLCALDVLAQEGPTPEQIRAAAQPGNGPPGPQSPLPPGYACPFCDMQGANLEGQTLTDVNLEGANLEGANLKSVTFIGVILSGAKLQRAALDGSKMLRSQKGRSDFSHADFTGATIAGTQFGDSDLQYAIGLDLGAPSLASALTSPEHMHNRKPMRKIRKTGHTLKATRGVSCGKADLAPLQSAIYVSISGADTDSCGASLVEACKTVAKGIARCGPSGCGVLVGFGEYTLTDPVVLRDGVSVYGGCVPSDIGETDFQSLITAPSAGRPAITASSMNSGSILQGFKVQGSQATSPGAASVAMNVTSSSNLKVLDVRVLAGGGANGSPGSTGARGRDGDDAREASAGTNPNCPTNGGNGSVTRDVSVDVFFASFTCKPSCSSNGCWGFSGSRGSTSQFASGGSPGGDRCVECVARRSDTGNSGTGGANASCGNKGIASSNTAGVFSNGVWTGVPGGNGTAGGNGGGGGGGGSGGYKAGACFWVKQQNFGNQGGGGGAGGCAGGPGGGGQQGGAALGMVLVGSTVTLSNSAIIGGIGGSGASGGTAGQGGTGGAGAGGLGNHGGGYGGVGAGGGAGGSGGGGAGGNGGPAIGVALVSNSSLQGTATVHYAGASGAVGGAGGGGQPIRAGACTGPDGDVGLAGLVAETRVY